MPGEGDVDIVEQALADHVELAAHRLLGRGAVEADRAGELARLDQLLDRDGGAEAGGPEEIVTATVTRGAFLVRLLGRLGLLRDARQRVVLAHDADDRAAAAVAGDEGRRHARHVALDGETLILRVVGQERRRTGLAQSGLGETPDLVAQIDQVVGM